MIFSRLRFKVRPPQELTPVIGSTVRLPCVAESDLRPTITWTKDGKSSLPVLMNGSLVLPNFKKSHEGSYTCKATNALTTIEAKVKINSPNAASCSTIRKFISNVSGNYVIDPDGAGGLAPFTVYCDMSNKNGVGVTVISHDSESRTHVHMCTDMEVQAVIHVTFITQERVCLSWRVSPESLHTVNSLSSMRVLIQF